MREKSYRVVMEKRQLVLIRLQPLLGEGLQRIVQSMEEVELVSLDCAELQTIDLCLRDLRPDMVLLAGEKEDDQATHLISYLLKQYEDIPVVWVELETTTLRLYTSHSLTANSTELIHAIREQNPRSFDIQITDKAKPPLAGTLKVSSKKSRQTSHS